MSKNIKNTIYKYIYTYLFYSDMINLQTVDLFFKLYNLCIKLCTCSYTSEYIMC